ncbi:MAG: polymer-forming cytoskeletal protein [Gemmatimonadaceae bacterium]
MRLTRIRVVSLAALLCNAMPPLVAQEKPRDVVPVTGGVPREVARDVTDRWNAADTKRVRGPFTLAVTDTLRGDLAVIDGPVKIAGVVTGHVVAINSDVTLEPTAHINGSLTVVGGDVIGRTSTSVKGDVRNWRAQLRYTQVNEHISPAAESQDYARLQRWRRNREIQGAFGDFFAASAHTYNRVEGLPLVLGPRLRTVHGDTRATVELFGVFRTGDQLSWKPSNLGHRILAEVRQGKNAGYAVGGRLFDEVAPVEHWALKDDEVGLASVLFTRDFRDYYQRHGGSGYASLFGPLQTSLTVSVGRERWGSRVARDPWSVFQSGDTWRANPMSDNGVMNLVTITGELDTRNDTNRPRSGWFLNAEYERGNGNLTSVAPTTLGTRTTVPGDITYARAARFPSVQSSGAKHAIECSPRRRWSVVR